MWYKMRHIFCNEHDNVKHIRALQDNITYVNCNRLKPNYADVVIKNYKIIYEEWHNCSSYKGIILSKMDNFLSTARKHNR